MNTQRTDGVRVTEALPDAGYGSPVRYHLIDKDGEVVGEFISSRNAVHWANKMWPDQSQDPDHTGKGWDIQVRPKKS